MSLDNAGRQGGSTACCLNKLHSMCPGFIRSSPTYRAWRTRRLVANEDTCMRKLACMHTCIHGDRYIEGSSKKELLESQK